MVHCSIETRSWTGQTKGQNSGSVRRVKPDYGNWMIISKSFETVLTIHIYYVIYGLSKQSFCVQLVDHLQCFVIRIGQRLTKPVLLHSRRKLQAKNQVQLDILWFHSAESADVCL